MDYAHRAEIKLLQEVNNTNNEMTGTNLPCTRALDAMLAAEIPKVCVTRIADPDEVLRVGNMISAHQIG